MGLEIIKSTIKKVSTSKVDPEPYFFRWESVMPLGSKDQKELIQIPCYQHKTCGHLVKVPPDRIPPKICPWCGVDTVKEAEQEEKLKESGAVLLEAPSTEVNLKKETFGEMNKYLGDDDSN